ncbi:unnamed protein product [Calypogeia fissa]
MLTTGMSAGVQTRTPKGAKPQSLFYRDLGLSPATHTSSVGADVASPNQVTAALWRENDGVGLDPPPPPFYTLEDRIEKSPESNTNLSFHSTPKFTERKVSSSRTGILSPGGGGGYSLPSGESQASQISSVTPQQQSQGSGTSSWWSPLNERRLDSLEAVERDGNGPVSGVVHQQQSGGLLTLPAPGEVLRPEFLAASAIDGGVEGDGWVTVFGFGVDETNSVMREFEKCGRIINHVPGPGGANWVHLQYQNHYDAQKALQKNGIQLNGALIVGVKRLDPLQSQGLTEKVKSGGLSFTALPPRVPTRGTAIAAQPSPWSPYTKPAETGGPTSRTSSVIASPAKSTLSKLVDLVFGM